MFWGKINFIPKSDNYFRLIGKCFSFSGQSYIVILLLYPSLCDVLESSRLFVTSSPVEEMPSESLHTAAEAVTHIQNALRTLAGGTGLGIISDHGASKSHISAPRDHDIHKLSSVSLPHTQRSIQAALDVLKSSITARESWTDEAVERLLRVKGDTVSRSCAIKASKAALLACRRLAVTSDPFASRSNRAVHRLHWLAEDCGTTTFRDDSTDPSGRAMCELSVSGAKFIASFSFSDLSSQTITVDVHFRFLTDANDGKVDHTIGLSFGALLRRERFDLLKLAFDSLMAMERLDESTTGLSLCDALHAFENDMLDAQNIEQKSNLSDTKRIGFGHGLIKRTALGTRISFMKRHSALLAIEPSAVVRQISRTRAPIVIRPSVQTASMPSFEFGECEMINTHAHFVLKLNRPVYVSLGNAQLLERVAGGKDAMKAALRAGSMRGAPVREMTSGRDGRSDHGDKRGLWPNLQMLLAPAVFGQGVSSESDIGTGSSNNAVVNTDQRGGKRLVSERTHWSQTATEFVASASLPGRQYIQFSHSAGDVVAAVALHRVPIRHPRDVQAVLAVLRQQIVFNELFRSCFAHPVCIEGKYAIVKQPVEVVLCETPSFLQLSMHDGVMEDILSMVVNISLGGDVSVSLKTGNGRRYVCSDRKATALLRISRNIPLTIRTIVQLARNASGNASHSVIGA